MQQHFCSTYPTFIPRARVSTCSKFSVRSSCFVPTPTSFSVSTFSLSSSQCVLQQRFPFSSRMHFVPIFHTFLFGLARRPPPSQNHHHRHLGWCQKSFRYDSPSISFHYVRFIRRKFTPQVARTYLRQGEARLWICIFSAQQKQQ